MLQVLLLQLPVPNNPALNVPLALGYLKAYAAAQGLLDHAAIEIMPRALADHAGDALLVESIVARRPDVLGLSLYTWNSERSLRIAARVKERLPDLRIVVGGPEVQRDNLWVLTHPAVDVAVLGEGEQTFAELLRVWMERKATDTETRRQGDKEIEAGDSRLEAERPDPGLTATLVTCASSLVSVAGIAYRDGDALRFTPDRAALSDLSVVPSPYLLGYLDVPPDSMMMIEVSRWCPYACSFCLYGRNMGTKLGNRYFGLERVLHEIRWAREHGVTRIHFVEANLNLVPLFWPLMRALADLNADRRMTFYAELRGEHLTDDVVDALDRANVRYVEVGLQSANPAALRAAHRRTDLVKWAAGTRRLYARNIEVYLDVILGLPADDPDGVAQTLEFIEREDLGSYDIFTLQVLPGTAVRQHTEQYRLVYQDRPPYYVLGSDRFSYAELRSLRRELKQRIGLDPDAVEGMPLPRRAALSQCRPDPRADLQMPITRVRLGPTDSCDDLAVFASCLANHVDLVLPEAGRAGATVAIATWIAQNPATIIDLYLICDDSAPSPDTLRAWRESLPFAPGYLDRVAIYRARDSRVGWQRVSPRLFLVLPWTAPVDPDAYADVAEIIWRFELEPDETLPLGAWTAAGGAGIWLQLPPELAPQERASLLRDVQTWETETGRMAWLA